MGRAREAGDELLPKERRFVLEYLKDHNGTKAAIRAGYAEHSAAAAASRLLRNVKVFGTIKVEVALQLERLKLDADLVLAEMKAIATLDPKGAYGPDGKLLPIAEMPPEVRAAIAGFEQREVEVPSAPGAAGAADAGAGEKPKVRVITTKVKWHAKHPAGEMIAKHAGLLKQQVDVRHTVSLEDLLSEADGDGGELAAEDEE